MVAILSQFDRMSRLHMFNQRTSLFTCHENSTAQFGRLGRRPWQEPPPPTIPIRIVTGRSPDRESGKNERGEVLCECIILTVGMASGFTLSSISNLDFPVS